MTADRIEGLDGDEVRVGTPIDGGDGVIGHVAEIRSVDDNEGAPPSVLIAWPEDPSQPERVETSIRDYAQEGPSGPYVYRLDAFDVLPEAGAMSTTDGL